MQQLRDVGALYDESPAGRYLHAFTEPLAGPFFFEIVQRDPGYDGYGIANAPARLTAQTAELSGEG